ncbi:uncharacterized protein EHS24_005524 [Apiotrichum porosum]|uniref:Isochorismatase-like domain-containing protein n=1 Tax=Apiotrichum porosum TaxID=105984 RepID=A0A427XCF7_9TREE|nr:uncharacterized protein EHS24_005524 [Apiotrichum porosum]RSH76535.1 hypothetical protein EHS24_005524 [Apiotrichum porosum]
MPSATVPLPANAALIVVDVQLAFEDQTYWGRRSTQSADTNVALLLDTWEHTSRPIIYVQHESSSPQSLFHQSNPGRAFKPFLMNRNTTTPALHVHKGVNSSFHGTPDMAAWLRSHGINDVVVCGITTNHCCETTARVGGNLGFNVWFVLDATHAFDQTTPDGEVVPADTIIKVTAANLHGEFATVVKAADVAKAATGGGLLLKVV